MDRPRASPADESRLGQEVSRLKVGKSDASAGKDATAAPTLEGGKGWWSTGNECPGHVRHGYGHPTIRTKGPICWIGSCPVSSSSSPDSSVGNPMRLARESSDPSP